jgi:hypothetical protein
LSRCWWSLNHPLRIPPFGLWGAVVVTRETVTSNKKGEETFGFSPLCVCFYGLHLTYVYPYPQTGEYPQYANSGNREW